MQKQWIEIPVYFTPMGNGNSCARVNIAQRNLKSANQNITNIQIEMNPNSTAFILKYKQNGIIMRELYQAKDCQFSRICDKTKKEQWLSQPILGKSRDEIDIAMLTEAQGNTSHKFILINNNSPEMGNHR